MYLQLQVHVLSNNMTCYLYFHLIPSPLLPPVLVQERLKGIMNQTADVYDSHHGLLHALDGHELVATMEVQSAGKDVGAGQSLEAELCSVGAATDGYDVAEAASFLDGMLGDVCHLGLILQLA